MCLAGGCFLPRKGGESVGALQIPLSPLCQRGEFYIPLFLISHPREFFGEVVDFVGGVDFRGAEEQGVG